jgi:uncharacterized membrane protein YhhN
MKKIILYLFILASLGELTAVILSLEFPQFIFKPLIMITLGVFYVSHIAAENRSTAVISAILCSLVGDVMLLFQHDGALYFMTGLFSFLLAHVFYILAYRQHRVQESEDALHGMQKIRFAFPIILAGTGLVVILFPVLGDLKFPVVVYAIVLILMVLNALFRFGFTSPKSFWSVFIGAVLFLISDSVLAINKFLQPVSNGVFIIMLTYILAQYLIISGLIAHTAKKR